VRIAKPILSITTPIGVVWGLLEAYRIHWWLALLMAAMLGVLGALMLMTVRRARAEMRAQCAPSPSLPQRGP
jgi:hypothetical protein